ncbi:hypothetical protein D1BOALGB6SA_5967 [Olavius sp. associated proteobacterium Delta 1]|nr:hypothetical protein D1BOALGB6SA_5967 [Olavius sp. associated proteobacterium Delta 1]
MSVSTNVDMARKKDGKKKGFIGKVAGFGNKGRKHVEVPKKDRDNYDIGDNVRVDPVE